MTTTCGILLIDSQSRVLLGHPTGCNDDIWSIPKGLMDDGETTWDTAVRELKEETSINLVNYEHITKFLGSTNYKGYRGNNKTLNMFSVFMPFSTIYLYNIVCKSTFGSEGLPEVDRYQWFPMDIVKMFIVEPQKRILDSAGM